MIQNLPVPYPPLTSAKTWEFPENCVIEESTHGLPAMLVITGIHRQDRKFVSLNVGDNLAEALMRYSPDCFGGSHVSIYRNNLSNENRIPDGQVPATIIGTHDFYLAYAGPADPITAGVLAAVVLGGAAGLTSGIVIGLAVGALVIGGTLVGTYLFEQPKVNTPETVSDQGGGQGTLGIPRNQARLGSRIPDIYGRMRTWPDLIGPVVDYYNGRDFSMDIHYCVGIGSYIFGTARFGDTELGGFPGTSIGIINPPQVPFNYGVLISTDQGKGFPLSTGTPIANFPFVELPDDRCTQIWVDFSFPGGLLKYNTGGNKESQTVSGIIQYRRVINGIAQAIQEENWSFSNNFNGPLRYTKIVPTGGGNLAPGTYQVRVAKTFSETSDNDIHVHDVEIARLASYRIAEVRHRLFNRERTYIHINVQSTRQTGAQSFEDFNIIASRIMPLMDGSPNPTQFTASERWCDAMTEMLLDPHVGGYPFSSIDQGAFLDVQAKSQQMDAGIGGKFNHIFDRFMDVDEQLQAGGSAMRTAVLQDYGLVSCVRDEVKSIPSALITPGNRAEGDEGSKTLTFANPETNDGVELEWFDSDNDYIRRLFRYPTNITLFNPRKIEVVGLTHWSQVWRRAVYENNKQKKRRRTNSVTLYEEGLLLLPMDLVEVVELWDTTRVSEVVNYFASNTQFQSFVDVEPGIDVNPNDYAIISAINGQTTEIVNIQADTAGFTNRIMLQNRLVNSITVPGAGAPPQYGGRFQVGARIAIYNDSRHIANRWLVGTVKPTDDRCLVTLIEYDATIFDGDTSNLPANPKPR